MVKKVYIGVGHGGSDPGAVANGFKEKNLTLPIALACQDELARHAVLTKISRTKDETDSVSEKVSECNEYDPDLALDIHINAGGGDGAEVFHTIKGGTGKTLAKNILAEIVKIGQNSRGTKTKKNSSGKDYFGFIRSTKAPAVIVECAFIDKKKDIQIIDTAEEQAAMGVAIAKGVLKTLGVAYIEPVKYRVQADTYSKKEAEEMLEMLKAAGHDASIVEVD
jgi:N-acetylmuramoyl-L-alanine amidase